MGILKESIFCLSVIASLAVAQDSAVVENEKNHPGNYLIVAPRTIRPSSPYSVSVNILVTKTPILLELSILDEKNKTIAKTQGVSGRDFKAGQAHTVSFERLPATLTAEAKYTLHATGKEASSGKVIFEQAEDLSVEAKSRSTFIQTDKAIYKPGATVHFRIIVVSPDLKPYKGKADIQISDPNQNVIKQFLEQQIDTGVLGKNDTLSLQLSEEPPLGEWKITAKIGGENTEKTFTVDKYVLPKFDVSVSPPPYVGLKDDIPVKVTAKYTYGKGVIGKLTVEAKVPWYYFPQPVPLSEGPSASVSSNREPSSPTFSKSVDLDSSGETTVIFTSAEMIERKMILAESMSSITIEFTASVTEKLTGTQRNGTASVTAYKHVEQVNIEKAGDTFKPGLDYNITISVVTQDGKPLPSAAKKDVFVTIYYQFPYVPPPSPPLEPKAVPASKGPSVSSTTIEQTEPVQPGEKIQRERVKLDSSGKAVMTLKPPANVTTLRIEAHYGTNDSEVAGSGYSEAAKSPTNSYLQLLAETASVQAGENMSFKILTTKLVPMVTVQVMSKGYITLSKHVEMSGQNGQITFASTNDMAPKSRVIAYAIHPENKEILVDAMDFRVGGLFTNNVSIQVEPKRAEPNQSVTFTVKAAPSSYVGLLSVDQSVLLLKSGNDITAEEVESDIASYDSTHYYPGWRSWGPIIEKRRKRSAIWCRWCWWNIGGQDAASVFENSGVIVLTDAYLYRQPPPPTVWRHRGKGKPAIIDDEDRFAESTETKTGGKDDGIASKTKKATTAPAVRKSFPETWIWIDSETRSDGTVTYKATVPDTITSWVTSAFAISDSAGLGIAPEPVKLEVFRQFFIRMDLPYSVKRGEKVALQILTFNYMDQEQKVTVTLDNSDNASFEFIQKPGSDTKKQLNSRVVSVPGGGASAVTYFPIIPRAVGTIKLLVTAIGSSGSDAVEMPLIVEPEGYPVYKTAPFVLELGKGSKTSKTVNLDIPKDIVPASARAEFTVNGDIMAPVLNNIEQLLQMPSGCGEQNMLSFVPDIVVSEYLKVTQRLTPEFQEKATRYMESGYQRELTYQRDDASYSAFGKSDPAGSTWLTAFVTRSFKQASKFIYVDADKLKKSIKYLRGQQKENGVYEEHGMVHHKAMQGGASQGGVALTAYILLAMLENQETDSKGLAFVENSLDNIKNDSYSLALATYALHLAKSSKSEQAFKYLENQAVQTGDGQKHWTYVVRDDEANEPSWWNPPRPVDVEATSYALLTYVLRGNTAGALPIVRWLVSKRNAFGGFSSTQDTVVALQALSSYASKTYSKNMDIAITIANGKLKQSFAINPTNAIVLQSVLLNELDKPVQLEANGKGVAYAQINYHYNVPKRNDPQPFQCLKSISQGSSDDLVVGLCCNYALKGKSNMVVIEMSALSGYVIDEDELNKLTGVKDLQRVETTKGGTVADIYINSLGPSPVCLNITANRAYQVADQKPALIVVYDYYDPGSRIEFEYSASKAMSLEEVCGDSCWGESAGGSSGSATTAAPKTTPKQAPKPKPKPSPSPSTGKANNGTKSG